MAGNRTSEDQLCHTAAYLTEPHSHQTELFCSTQPEGGATML